MTELPGERFEHFVAHLLTAMGYRAQVTPPNGDGGFDILAQRGEGLTIIRTPVHAPNANAYAERWVGTSAASASTGC